MRGGTRRRVLAALVASLAVGGTGTAGAQVGIPLRPAPLTPAAPVVRPAPKPVAPLARPPSVAPSVAPLKPVGAPVGTGRLPPPAPPAALGPPTRPPPLVPPQRGPVMSAPLAAPLAAPLQPAPPPLAAPLMNQVPPVILPAPTQSWGPGGPVGNGGALGMLQPGMAAGLVGAPPANGMCWYYRTPDRRTGFWDRCR